MTGAIQAVKIGLLLVGTTYMSSITHDEKGIYLYDISKLL